MGAIARLNRAHGRLPVVEAQAFDLHLRAMTHVTAFLEDGLNIAAKIGRGFGGSRRCEPQNTA
jgi:hypothetical protein